MLQNLTQHFLTTINNDNSTIEEVNNAAKEFLDSFQVAPEPNQALAMQELCASLELNNSKYTGVLANFIGYLFETGFNPDAVFAQMIKYFENLLFIAVKVTESFEPKMETALANETEEDETDIYELFDEHFREFARQNPEAAAAWEKFEETWCCGIALFSVSKTARREARYLRQMVQRASEFGHGTHWFNVMLSVFDDEPFIAIELEKQIGVKGKMSGVVENFQLHTLLMDAFPQGWFSSGNLAPEIIQNAKGFGEQCLDIGVIGRWNMYDWTLVNPGVNLSDCSDGKFSKHWIWGEGKPEDIPLFEGYRVILLGKPSYERNWGAQRMFSHLKAELKVDQKLSKSEVNELLHRMAATPKPISPFE